MQNSIGNLKNSGLQGNNFPWQLKMLLGQQCACDALQDIAASTDTLEPLLAQILAAIQNGTDYEAALVVDDAGVTWLEIRIWNGTSFDPPIYFAAGSNVPGSPVLPITYINPNSYLAQIVSYTSNLVSIEAGTPDALGQTTMSASMPVTIASDQTALPVTAVDLDIRNLDCATDTVSVCSDGTPVGAANHLPVDATQAGAWDITNITGTVSLPTGAATETTLAAIDTKLTPATRTPGIKTFVNAAGSVSSGLYSFSIANVGSASGLVDSETLPAGVTINFDAGALNNTLGGLTFDATGTTFVITTIS